MTSMKPSCSAPDRRNPEGAGRSWQGRIREVRIDMDSPVNMTWAPNGRGVHKSSALRALVEDLETAASAGPGKVKEMLLKHGKIAYDKGF